jgi:hypothetical protein
MLVGRLRRRGLAIGIDDCNALRAALTAGYGLDSDEALRDVCVTLWAKTSEEAALIRTAFAGSGVPEWTVAATVGNEQPGDRLVTSPDDPQEPEPMADGAVQDVVRTREMTGGFTTPGLWPRPGSSRPPYVAARRADPPRYARSRCRPAHGAARRRGADGRTGCSTTARPSARHPQRAVYSNVRTREVSTCVLGFVRPRHSPRSGAGAM